MITLQSNSEKYSALYEEAWQALKDANQWDDDDAAAYPDGFSCLEQYFTKIGSLAILHANNVNDVKAGTERSEDNVGFKKYSKFLMLPLEEEYFKIDANSRNIHIPAVYAKNGVSVIGDQIAETLLFEIDRYFDYVDLTRMSIYVQWTNPANQEGATQITMVDFDDKKIRFGWPLSRKVTVEGNGKLQFSVRFFRREGEAIAYSLNTLPATVAIKNTLYANLNDNIEVDEPSVLFAAAVKNGSDSGAIVKPLDAELISSYQFPEYVYLGEEYKKSVSADGTLKAQAYANDGGKITYSWSYKPYEQEYSTVVKEMSAPDEYIKTSDTSRQEGKRYYIPSATGYSIYAGDDFSQMLYEAISVYTLPNEGQIVGNYTVSMQNKIGANTTTTTSSFEIPGPKSITVSDLTPNGTIIPDVTELSIVAEKDNEKAVLSYEWQYKERESDDFVALENSNDATYSLAEGKAGWYRAKVTSTLNRAEKSVFTANGARVTEAPKPVKIIDNTAEGYVIINANNDGTATMVVNIENINPDGKDMALVSDKIHYVWKRNPIDGTGEKEVITEAYKGVVKIEDNMLIVDLKSLDNATNNKASFFCEVQNELNTRFSSKMTSEPYIIVDAQ